MSLLDSVKNLQWRFFWGIREETLVKIFGRQEILGKNLTNTLEIPVYDPKSFGPKLLTKLLVELFLARHKTSDRLRSAPVRPLPQSLSDRQCTPVWHFRTERIQTMPETVIRHS